MHKYFNDAVKIFELTKHKPSSYFSILSGIDLNQDAENITQHLNFWYQEESASVINDSRMVIRFNLLMLPLSRGNIYIHLVMMVFISFIGLYLIYLSFEKIFSGKEVLLLVACFGAPSVMFWSSGIMKEGLLVFFLGILIYHLFHFEKISIKTFSIIVLAFCGMFFSKFYVALAIVPSLLFILFCFVLKKISNTINLVLTCSAVLIFAFLFNTLLDNLPLEKLSKKQNDFINLSVGGVYLSNNSSPYDTIFTLKSSSLIPSANLASGHVVKLKNSTVYHHWQNPGYADTLIAHENQNNYTILKLLEPTGSAITLKRLMPNYKSIIFLFPEGFLNVFFRPFIFDIENLFSLLACFENILFLILIIVMFILFVKPHESGLKIIYFSLLFVFTLYSLVGLTTPVLGAAVRYKVPAIPFLMISIFLLLDFSRLEMFFSKPFKKLKWQ